MKKLVLLIFILSFISIDLFSQNVISGVIQEDGSGERLSYSNVYIDEIKIEASNKLFIAFISNFMKIGQSIIYIMLCSH